MDNANLVTSAFSKPFTFTPLLGGSGYSLVITNISLGAGPPSGPCVSGGVAPPTCTGDMANFTAFDLIWAQGMGDASHYTSGDFYGYYYTNVRSAMSLDLKMANQQDSPGGGSGADAAAVEILPQPQ
jgi:hypothetical protein